MKKMNETNTVLKTIDVSKSEKKFLEKYKHEELVKKMNLTDAQILKFSPEIKKAVDSYHKCSDGGGTCGNGGFHYVLHKVDDILVLKVEECPNHKEQKSKQNIINHYEIKEMTTVDYSLTINDFKDIEKDLLEMKDLIVNKKQNIYIFNEENNISPAINALTNELAAEGYKIGFYNMIDFVSYATMVTFDKSAAAYELNDKLKNVDILVLDEVGNEKFQRFINTNILYTVFNSRNITKKPIIFISQYELKDLKKQYEMQVKSTEKPSIEHYIQRIKNIINKKIYKF